jgi:uncharacterized repeat protein (TIGR03803 family)
MTNTPELSQRSNPGHDWRIESVVIIAMLTLGSAQPTHSQTLKVLYSLSSPAVADYGVIRDPAGNLYGTTIFGGAFRSGSVFKIKQGGAEAVLYSFTGGVDGNRPSGGLVRDSAGNLYGVTASGGAFGYGTVFKVVPGGKESVLYSFTNQTVASGPIGRLVRDSSGYLYGVTASGGIPNSGTVFKLSPGGVLTVLYTFTGGNGGPDGANPTGGLVRDPAGNLFGTTIQGGAFKTFGTVFKVDSAGNETILHSFSGGTDGGYPNGELVGDSSGNIYGTTGGGGAFGQGTVFKVDSSGNETVLYSFDNLHNDGRNPSGGLYRDSAGNLYGNTSVGGEYGWGTTYRLDTSNNETILYSFTGGSDGRYPIGPLTHDGAGNLYGTTDGGGSAGYGEVFKMKP